MGFFETVLAGLAVAGTVGITTLAVKQPLQYRRIGLALMVLAGAVQLGMMIFIIGGLKAQSALVDYLEPGTLFEASEAVKATQPDPQWVMLGGGAVILYFFMLMYLPNILGGEKRE